MTLNDYQDLALATAIYPMRGTYLGLSYVNAKLNGEAGEVSEHIGKMLRDDYPKLENGIDQVVFETPVPIGTERRGMILLELGDVLWYVAALARELNMTLADVAKFNLEKLALRKKNQTLSGSGSDR